MTWGLGIEWPPLAASPEPDTVHDIITNVIEIPGDDPSDEDDVITGRASEFVINTASEIAIGTQLVASLITRASAVWPTANKAFFIPFQVHEEVTAHKLYLNNGSAVSGNIDLGIYEEDGTRLVSTGSTAQAGTSTLQIVDITDTVFGPGRFYMAVAIDNVTGTTVRYTDTVPGPAGHGVKEQTSAFALPSAATLVDATAGYIPHMGISLRSTDL